MQNNLDVLGILLDTSFLLPLLGIDVTSSKIHTGWKKLQSSSNEIFYTDLSLYEATRVAARKIRSDEFDSNRFRVGVNSIVLGGEFNKALLQPDAYNQALDYWIMGHHDLFDNLLYVISLRSELGFLTIDEDLRNFIEENDLPNTLISVTEL